MAFKMKKSPFKNGQATKGKLKKTFTGPIKPMVDKDGDGIPIGVDIKDTPGGKQSTPPKRKPESKPKAKKSGPKPVSNTKTDPRKRPYDDGRNKGTLKGKTGFEYDAIPVTNVLNKIGKVAKKGGKLLKKAYIDDNIKIAKNIKKYFTEK